ncbi:MAG TPA: hypothetical protein VKM93_07190 [Terriglobia bacterium]|nr:hypothetical protein [Terriglobia bacterium]
MGPTAALSWFPGATGGEPQGFDRLRHGFFAALQPEDQVEAEFVEDMVEGRWEGEGAADAAAEQQAGGKAAAGGSEAAAPLDLGG